MRHRGFTLIELLTVVAIVLLLAGVLLVFTRGAREDAKEAAVFASMESTQQAVTRCLFEGHAMYCRGATFNVFGVILGEDNCEDQGGTGSGFDAYAVPAIDSALTGFVQNSALCGDVDTPMQEYDDFGTWPDITQYGFRYGTRAESDNQKGIFAFYAVEDISNTTDDRTVICCTQLGCTISERTAGQMSFLGGNVHWPLTPFCLQEAGFTFGGGGNDPDDKADGN
jgi:prepilin-type N-terminal cleavage/methylation domain-containing protein